MVRDFGWADWNQRQSCVENTMTQLQNSLDVFIVNFLLSTLTNVSVHWLRWGCAEFRGPPLVYVDL